ncbi:MAG: hypothetical protein M1821_005868 [Bathelium mastoideum]|nr:MAG: hypothetical protein M1821_005868 [Bathelium mastoideum]
MAYLRYWLNEDGHRVYTLKKIDPYGRPTLNAHPAKYTPDEDESTVVYRIEIKDRFGLMPAQAKINRKKLDEQIKKNRAAAKAKQAEVGILGEEALENGPKASFKDGLTPSDLDASMVDTRNAVMEFMNKVKDEEFLAKMQEINEAPFVDELKAREQADNLKKERQALNKKRKAEEDAATDSSNSQKAAGHDTRKKSVPKSVKNRTNIGAAFYPPQHPIGPQQYPAPAPAPVYNHPAAPYPYNPADYYNGFNAAYPTYSSNTQLNY